MKQTILLFATALLLGIQSYAQTGVAINTTGAEPDGSAMLDVSSTEKGILIPRMTEEQRTNIVSPVSGLLVFQTDGSTGFYYYNGTLWILLESVWQSNGSDISYSAGKVGIGVDSPEDVGTAPLNVQGGILYKGGQTGANTPGLLYFDPASGNGVFKYRDNTDAEQVLGTGSINYSGTLWSQVAGDYVAYTDVISIGSLAVGFDAAGGENFGFATIILKENNLRIKFDDTSQVSGFPANDWQLTANESAFGGANYFAIEDLTGSKIPFMVMAGAPTNSLYISQQGNVGIGTDNPLRKLHVTDAMRLQPSTEPEDAVAGDLYFDSSSNKLRCHDGTSWHDLW